MIAMRERADAGETGAARRRWAATTTFESHGALIGVHADDAAAACALREALPEGSCLRDVDEVNALYTWTTTDRDDRGRPLHVVRLRCSLHGTRTKEIGRTRHLAAAAALLRHDAEFRVAVHAPERLFVHAAAVVWQGRAIVLPGYSHAGKSTLTAALVAAGAEYLSDEYTVLDADGLVHAFARRLHLRAPDRSGSTDVAVHEIGGVAAVHPVPVGMIVAAHYRAGARWRPRLMTPGEAALTMFDNTIVARLRPAHAMERIARAIRPDTIAVRGVRGDAAETARLLLRRVTRAFADARAA